MVSSGSLLMIILLYTIGPVASRLDKILPDILSTRGERGTPPSPTSARVDAALTTARLARILTVI
ncbi:MAG: hypothetical protein EA382_00865 [Spirochaetaceae bacterium]|nr:MAG: hypothetical protein EA382_00865 [Spirochaetaceae bacterium]